ncbi:MAG: prepilin-type N-terminal cleavage/methylation domain-containing protein [Labilithrix sp.]|nr:prepilin-type N-terminal cleavage/methylation domain-containing protein [Labilithrix sp.]
MMKARGALRRSRARRASRAFTLVELMVVVVLISIVALLATPSFTEARDDRIAFDYARQYQQILVQGRARAAGTGSAHLALLTPGTGGRGVIRLYASLDDTGPPGGPNPVSSCKAAPDQWAAAEPEITDYRLDHLVPGAGRRVRFINFAELNREGVNVSMDLRATLTYGEGGAGVASAPTTYLAVCITPAGVTYVGSGGSTSEAVTALRAAPPFTGVAEARIQRGAVGLRRLVTISGGGAPRLRSE